MAGAPSSPGMMKLNLEGISAVVLPLVKDSAAVTADRSNVANSSIN